MLYHCKGLRLYNLAKLPIRALLSTTPITSTDDGEAFQIDMHELTNRYSDIFAKLGKPIPYDITYCIELHGYT